MTAPDAPLSSLVIQLFGPFEVRVNGCSLPRLRSRKGQWLLALLTLRADCEVERSWLAGTLWPDNSESQALASLRMSLKDLRRALGPEAHRLRSPTPHTLSLELANAAVDLLAFDASVVQGDPPALERATSLYRGPLLEGWTEEWVFQERQAREQVYLQALECLAAQALRGGDPSEAERHVRLAVAADPLRESAQRALMQALAAGGNYGAAMQVYREVRLLLHRELNTEPDPETMALFQQIRAEARDKAARGSQLAARGPDSGGSDAAGPAEGFAASYEPRAASGSLATLTFLLTDIEGSTRLWLQDPEAMRHALARHDALLVAEIEDHGGTVLKQRGEGDSCFAVFSRATAAVAAAVALQRTLALEPWPAEAHLRVRVALHTGEAELRDGDYYGLAVNHCARLRAVGHGGQTLLSQTTAALVRHELPKGVNLRDLGTHRLKDLQRPEPIFQLVHPELPAEFPPLRSLEAFAHNLPLQLTRFIGREREMAEVKRLLQTVRLLTLTGAGGCGKTRLALQVAAELLPEYPDGVWLVELAALADPALVAQTVAAALGVREEPGRARLATLVDRLRARSLVLVLDNCEHLLSACAQLAEGVLRGCPSVRVLATSREGLGITGEQTYRVPSLPTPDPAHLPSLEHLQEFDAVSLFTDRAILSRPDFAVTPENASAVASVCHRLDGIPLAIELAAARLKALPVEKLNERLDDRFRLLTGGSRTALPRQQTLQALIDWSHDLLSEAERTLLRRLSVFAGGWTLEAAEAVCPDEAIQEWEVLDLLTTLVEKSLVVYEEQEEARYRLLETVRQYARDRLLAGAASGASGRGENDAVRGRHRDWMVTLAERAGPELFGPDQVTWLQRLEREHDNLRAALDSSLESGEVQSGLRIGGSVWRLWYIRGYWEEGHARLAALLSHPEAGGRVHSRAEREPDVAHSERARLRVKALDGAGVLARHLASAAAARSHYEEMLAIGRELGDKQVIASALNSLGRIAVVEGRGEQARPLFERGLALARDAGDRWEAAFSLQGLGLLAFQKGDDNSAWSLLQEALAMRRELGDKGSIATTVMFLADVATRQSNWRTARTLIEENLALSRELGTHFWPEIARR